MSLDLLSERVCYVQCNFCDTTLAVSVPSSNMHTIVTVRCGHCANLLSVNMGASLHTLAIQDSHQTQKVEMNNEEESGSSSKGNNNLTSFESAHNEPPTIPHVRPPEKRQRVPSAYNRFIKEEIQRIKASNPDITHREAFSSAAKNWAHFPDIHFGLKVEGNKHPKLDHSFGGETTPKSNAFFGTL